MTETTAPEKAREALSEVLAESWWAVGLRGLIGIAFLILAFRLFWVQVVRHPELNGEAIAQHEARVIDRGLRGDVVKDCLANFTVEGLAHMLIAGKHVGRRKHGHVRNELSQPVGTTVDDVHIALANGRLFTLLGK